MEDRSSGRAAAPHAALHYMLEPEWPHRAVPVHPRRPHRARQDEVLHPSPAEAAGDATPGAGARD